MSPHLLSTLAHDIRNLATPITMLLQVLRYRQPVSYDAQELDLIQQQVDQLIFLTDNLRCLHRLSDGKAEFNNKYTSLGEAIETAAAKARPWLATQELYLETPLPNGRLVVAMEENALVLLIVNLLLHAAPITPARGSLVLKVSEEPDTAVIQVNYAGGNKTSLGWQVTKQLVERHGGSVEVTPEGLVARLPLRQE